jgi:amidase
VAAGEADLGLGTDTGGSVRVPASYCGLWGLRTSHGRVPLLGARALAPSFSTAGLLAPGAPLLRRAGAALLAGAAGGAAPLPGCGGGGGAQRAPRLLVASDAFGLALPEAESALRAALTAASASGALEAPEELDVGASLEGLTGLGAWFDVFRIVQVRPGRARTAGQTQGHRLV